MSKPPASLGASRVHRMPFGAEIEGNGSVCFRLFAPSAASVHLALEGSADLLPMHSRPGGWFELSTTAAHAGSRYRFQLPDGSAVPDPASRYQPQDVHGPSEVVDPASYVWRDQVWRGRPWAEAILYELHIGTFTAEGTFESAGSRLDHLAALGVTALEVMCVADFAGLRNWGYDGVLLYAPDSAYGRPDDLKAFIDAAHERGLMVILDVVYNHFGAEGNYLSRYFPQISTGRHSTPWGEALNFDGEFCEQVRDFIIHNALYWIEEFHVDGLRLDAAHAMIDTSPRHILDELADRVRALAAGRIVHLILENEQNIAQRLIRDENGEATCYTAQWNHDITHLLGASMANTGSDLQQDDGGETARLGKALAEGFVIAAQTDGPPASCPPVTPTAYVAFIQTHDLIGNRIFGERIYALASPEAVRAVAAIYLLAPQIPMMFMGDEFGASTPFPYFCDFHGELAEAVRKGRCEQLANQHPSPDPKDLERAPNPQAEETFLSAKLNWDEAAEGEHAEWLRWYQRLLRTRREEISHLLPGVSESCGHFKVLRPGALEVHWTLANATRLHLAANLCSQPATGFATNSGRPIWQQGEESASGTLGPWSVRWLVEDSGS